jgi:hypothetical protein
VLRHTWSIETASPSHSDQKPAFSHIWLQVDGGIYGIRRARHWSSEKIPAAFRRLAPILFREGLARGSACNRKKARPLWNSGREK